MSDEIKQLQDIVKGLQAQVDGFNKKYHPKATSGPTFDISDIKPGMSPDQARRAAGAIRQALIDGQDE